MKPDEQYVIEKIQKALGTRTLTEADVARNEQAARKAIAKKKRITGIIVKIVFIIAVAAALYFSLTKNGFSLKFFL